MAERRMFAKKIIDSDEFLDMPLSTQALYFHLCMRADDDGFTASAKRIVKTIDAKEDDLKLLFAKQFIIPFDTGVVVIKHWKIHNYIQSDRYKGSLHIDEKRQLLISENKSYVHEDDNVYNLDTKCIPSLGKVSLGKSSKELDKEIQHRYGEYKNVLLSDSELEKLKEEFPNDWNIRIERVSSYVASKGVKYKNFLATIRSWARKENQNNFGTFSNQPKKVDLSDKIRLGD